MLGDADFTFICPNCSSTGARIEEATEGVHGTDEYHADCCGARVLVVVLDEKMLDVLEERGLAPTKFWV